MSATFVLMTSALAQAPSPPASPPEEDIRGPRGLIEIPQPEQTNHTIWWIVLGSLVALTLLFFAYRKWGKRRIATAPREVALKQLQQLAARGTGQSATVFAEQAALILRHYFTERFGVAASRRTTEEFLRELIAQPGAWSDRIDHLREFLFHCDLAKFAGQSLTEEQRQRLIEQANDVITTSDPVTRNTQEVSA